LDNEDWGKHHHLRLRSSRPAHCGRPNRSDAAVCRWAEGGDGVGGDPRGDRRHDGPGGDPGALRPRRGGRQ